MKTCFFKTCYDFPRIHRESSPYGEDVLPVCETGA